MTYEWAPPKEVLVVYDLIGLVRTYFDLLQVTILGESAINLLSSSCFVVEMFVTLPDVGLFPHI